MMRAIAECSEPSEGFLYTREQPPPNAFTFPARYHVNRRTKKDGPMKKRKSITHISLLAAALFTTIPDSHAGIISILKRGNAGEEKPVVQKVAFVGCAKVKAVEGNAEKLCGIEKWERIEAGSHVEPGDVIRTQQGEVLLEMCESSSLVKVIPTTVVRLIPLKKSWDKSIVSGIEEKSGCMVRAVSGKAFFKFGTEEWQPVLVNTVLPLGAEVRVPGEGRVCLFNNMDKKPLTLAGNSSTRIGSESGLVVTLSAPR